MTPATHPPALSNILEWPRPVKRLVVVALDIAMGLFAMWLAFSLRLEVLHWPKGMQWLAYALAPLLALPIFMSKGLYRAIFRYTGIAALVTTGKAVAIYGALLFAILMVGQWIGVPRSVGILQPVIFLLLVGASRALCWFWLAGRRENATHRLLIYGAGSAGAQTAAAMQNMQQHRLMGFLDDDEKKSDSTINGVRVYSPDNLLALIERLRITDVLLAIPSTTSQRRHQIIQNLGDAAVRVRTLPGLSDLASGRVTMTDFQDLDIEDLLGREPVAPNPQLLGRNIRGKAVLVTGAGGSIGSELCRQIAAQSPALLVLLDHSEYALYTIHHELEALKTKGLHACELVPILANVRDEARVLDICKQYSPHTIYHAAAYKHVPMVESNPGEGVLNNVFGTLNMVKAAIANQVQDFVLISTDKAVRPTNIMGATKRVAEMILQAVAASTTPPFPSSKDAAEAPWKSPTRFSMVRFGNVLGSSGSVIPLFRHQISTGGPVTVTHPEVSRYFMTIPEAAQLVLQAGAMAEGGDVFVLDMGEPIKILEIARRMVTLSGLSVRDETHPDADIELIFTGLRPGEKIYEELLIGENTSSTEHKQILRAREEYLHWRDLQNQLQSLKDATRNNSLPAIKTVLDKLFSDGTLEYR
ncbi:polysaccharide biosynthesis protein [Acidovorax sp. HMWF029]|uniref:polysaccharide biosynthesis protein n=1 Tax=Acidovorax sp. HMWF029 TaxID=2056863 RepID=UPI000D3D8B82|nr:nucleoside-diphosphate sugar epimerase/dehydratase [Acidovorax sp. HMWF029]PTT19014.1 polysaccharide biosynthesis protein [Acidovorax sp. HMWF029]